MFAWPDGSLGVIHRIDPFGPPARQGGIVTVSGETAGAQAVSAATSANAQDTVAKREYIDIEVTSRADGVQVPVDHLTSDA
jgi:hypothetical protein